MKIRPNPVRVVAGAIPLVAMCALLLGMPQSAAADEYFSYLRSLPETLVARAYDNWDEIDADINAREENRRNPPVYDPEMNAAMYTTQLGIGSMDSIRPTFPLISSGQLLIIWESRWSSGFEGDLGGLRQHKAFQLSKQGDGDIRRIEIRTRFNFGTGDQIGKIDGRGYVWDPSGAPLPGQVRDFYLHAESWTRFWALVDFDNSQFSLWVADQQTPAVQLFDGLQYSDMSGGLNNFWFEYNTSQTEGCGCDLNIWARHFAAIHNPADIQEIISRGSLPRPLPPEDLR